MEIKSKADRLTQEKIEMENDVRVGKEALEAAERKVQQLEIDLKDAYRRIKEEQEHKNRILEMLRSSEDSNIKVKQLDSMHLLRSLLMLQIEETLQTQNTMIFNLQLTVERLNTRISSRKGSEELRSDASESKMETGDKEIADSQEVGDVSELHTTGCQTGRP